MYGKVLLVAGLAVGYVLGSRRGREGYEKLKRQASETWRNPNVQRTVSQAQKFAQEKIPVVGDAISGAVDKVNDAAGAESTSSTGASGAGSSSGSSNGSKNGTGSGSGTGTGSGSSTGSGSGSSSGSGSGSGSGSSSGTGTGGSSSTGNG
jgi:hypothetical protein